MNYSCPVIRRNEHAVDRIIRVAGGTALFGAAHWGLEGTSQAIASAVAAVFILTGAVGFCGIYAVLGISTARKHT